MKFNTVIFDMDGLLIDSEPLWVEAEAEIFGRYGIQLSEEDFIATTGLRIREVVERWFALNNIPKENVEKASSDIIRKVADKIVQKGRPMAGLAHILNFFIQRKFKLGLASSSPQMLIDVVLNHLKIGEYFHAVVSGASLDYGKPHPQVYINCAEELDALPHECICFEDSFNGMIAAKAARMKCVVVPAPQQHNETRWSAADLKISSLQNFNELLLQTL